MKIANFFLNFIISWTTLLASVYLIQKSGQKFYCSEWILIRPMGLLKTVCSCRISLFLACTHWCSTTLSSPNAVIHHKNPIFCIIYIPKKLRKINTQINFSSNEISEFKLLCPNPFNCDFNDILHLLPNYFSLLLNFCLKYNTVNF